MRTTKIEAATGDGSRRGYFQRAWPAYSILFSFFLLTLPLCILAWHDDAYLVRSPIGVAYLIGLGMTHFLITLVIYLQSANRRHFASSRANLCLYFGLPVAIFVAFDLYNALGVAVAFPLVGFVVRGGIRLLDFQHYGRQSFGVMQLFRKRSECQFPRWMAAAEDQFFKALTILLFVTFLTGGRYDASRPEVLLATGVVTALFARVLFGYAMARPASGSRRALVAPLAYLLLQTGSGALATCSTSLYGFALAMHYVEYHVLMVPRCFHSPLDRASRADRVFGAIRRRRVLFYGLLVLAAVPVARLTWLGMGAMIAAGAGGGGISSRFLIAAFDGLFVFHYLIESRIWRFGDPFYRQSLTPLYFGEARANPRPASATAIAGPARVATPA